MGHPQVVYTHPKLFPELFQENRAGQGKSHVGTAEYVNDNQSVWTTVMKDFLAFAYWLGIEWCVIIFLGAVLALPATVAILSFFGIVILFCGWDTKRGPETIR